MQRLTTAAVDETNVRRLKAVHGRTATVVSWVRCSESGQFPYPDIFPLNISHGYYYLNVKKLDYGQ